MRKAYIRFGDGSISTDASPGNLGKAWNDPQSRFWLDVFPPDGSDVAILRDVFHFHPLAIEDSITYTQRPKIEHYDDSAGGYCHLVYHGSGLGAFRKQLRTQDIDMFVA